MTGDGGFCINPEAVHSVVGDMTAKALQLYNVLNELRALNVPAAWGQLGSPVRAASQQAHRQTLDTLGTVLTAIQQTINKIEACARLYAQFDQEIAQSYGDGSTKRIDMIRTTTTTASTTASASSSGPVPSMNDANALKQWLADRSNQVRAGIYEAYTGELGYPASLPDAARTDDRVVLTAPDGTVTTGVVGPDRRVHTGGVAYGGMPTSIQGGSQLFVYRPIGATLR
jgi:hypothetical protein